MLRTAVWRAAGREGSAVLAKWVRPSGAVAVEADLQRLFDVADGAREGDGGSGAPDGGDVEVVLFEPGGDLRDIVGRRAEPIGILLGGEPAVIVGRGGVLLRGEEAVQIGLLFGRLLEDESDG